MVELDVHATRDGRVVVIHDATVDRTTDGSGRVDELDLAEVKALDAGHAFVDPDGEATFRGRGVRIPLLDDVLEALPRTRLNVEIKAAAAAAGTVRAIRAHGAETRVLVAAGVEADRRAAGGYRGPRGASGEQLRRFWLAHRIPVVGALYTPRADALQVPPRWEGREVVTTLFVEAAHRRNLPVHVWTVDDPAEMRRLLDLGVDGIQSDRPDLLARVLTEEAGRPAPPAAGPATPPGAGGGIAASRAARGDGCPGAPR